MAKIIFEKLSIKQQKNAHAGVNQPSTDYPTDACANMATYTEADGITQGGGVRPDRHCSEFIPD